MWYVILPDPEQQGIGFDQAFSWDIPLLDGYNWKEIGSCSRGGSLDGFFGTRVNNAAARLKQISPDAVLVTGWHQYSLVQFSRACNTVGIPCLVRGDSNNLKSRAWIKRWLHGKLLKLYQGFLYVGQANQGFYRDNGVDKRQLYFVPHFVDNDWFQQQLPDRSRSRKKWRKKMGIDEQEFVILYVGKLQPKKHVADLIRGVAMLSRITPDYCLVITGDGVLLDELQVLAEQLKLRILFTGFQNQSELPAIYLSSDCLVLPSDYGETWGLVVNEAMNCGLPVVVSDRVGCGPDLVIKDKTGYCYPFGDFESLARALEVLWRNPARRREMGIYASQHINKYSFQAATKGLLKALDCVS